ncbi:MAG: Fur family transcriptional regulator [Actinobacteria bacterium]|nr:Fur family transcriptional regulator [Actinomycetota bacterium]
MPSINLRSTKQRKAVAEVLATISKFSSAQEVHSILFSRGEKVGLATVYRTLQALAETGAIDVLRNDGEALYRACSNDHHHHLVCTGCNKTTEISAPEVEIWTEKIAREQGYVISGHTIEVFGLCKNCR